MGRRTVAKGLSMRTPFVSTSYETVRMMLETAREHTLRGVKAKIGSVVASCPRTRS